MNVRAPTPLSRDFFAVQDDYLREAIDTMIRRGYRAAMEKDSELAAIRRWIGDAKFRRNAKPAVNIDRQNIVIDSVQIAGVSPSEADYLRSKLYIKGGSIVNRYQVDRAVSSIFGLRVFSGVSPKATCHQ